MSSQTPRPATSTRRRLTRAVGALVASTTAVALAGITVSGAVPAAAVSPASLAATAPAAAPSTSTADTPAGASSVLTAGEQSASVQAASSGSPVPVDELTTSTNQVLANPDGTFTLDAHAKPVRVRADAPTVSNGADPDADPDGDGWVPVDTTLHVGADGRIRPRATAVDVSFSSGGSAALVTTTDSRLATDPDTTNPDVGTNGQAASGDSALSVSWPDPLPAPVLEGDHATYPEIMPGVDLQVTAHVDSYSQVLIVKTPAAAANPDLTHIDYGVTTDGVTLATSPTGGLTATDAAGAVVFTSPAATMWDSSVNPQLGGTPTPTDPGGGDEDPLTVTLQPTSTPPEGNGNGGGAEGAATMTVTPPAAELRGATTAYPVYIDPGLGGGETHTLTEKNDGTSIYDPTDFLRVGKCSWRDCNPMGYVARSFFSYNIAALHKRNGKSVNITSAHIYTNEIWNAHGCTAENVRLYTAHGFGPASTWSDNTAVTHLATLSSNKGGGSGCAAGNLDWSNTAITDRFEEMGASPYDEAVFGLVSDNEGDPNAWKKFDNDSSINISYSFPPNTATINLGNGVSYFVCGGTSYAIDPTPTITATGTSNNGAGATLDVFIAVVDAANDAVWKYATFADVASGANSVWSPTLPDGTWYFRATVRNHGETTNPVIANSGTILFDFAAPPTPTITSWDYPAGGNWGAPAARTVYNSGSTTSMGSFTLTSPGANGFSYAWKNGSVPSVARQNCGTPASANNPTTNQPESGWVTATNGVAVLPVPVELLASSTTNLTVKATDASHNQSGPSATYYFTMAPADTTASTANLANRTEAESQTPNLAGGAWTDPDSGTSGTSAISSYLEASPGATSGGQQQHVTATHIGQTITYTVSVARAGLYDVQAQTYSNYNAGAFTTAVDGNNLLWGDDESGGDPGTVRVTDNWQPSPSNANYNLGGAIANPDGCGLDTHHCTATKPLRLTAGPHTITFTVHAPLHTQANQPGQPTGYVISTDYLRLVWLGS